MGKVYVEITNWPGGIGLEIGNNNGSTSVAGSHGGGIGHLNKRFVVDADRLIEAIKDNEFEEKDG